MVALHREDDEREVEANLLPGLDRASEYATIVLRVEEKVQEVHRAEWLYFLEREI